MNSICLTGRIAHELEPRQTQGGTSVVSFTIAVKRPKTKDATDFIDCVAWGNTADFICQNFSKGKSIGVCGCLTSRKYEDKYGNKRIAFEVRADDAYFCGDKPTQETRQPKFEEITGEDDVPF